ncbi:MAG TPA: hypothetical protein DD379_05465 [Cyanobacteria bacterium UBA11162]|nr:hypothetical protein [Cyanobacteria bacterium UBA11162]
MSSKKPILITGFHRSGTTWVGKMLAASPSVRFVAEPFNLNHSQCLCGHQFKYWFQYISSENESHFYTHLKHTLDLSYNFAGELRTVRTAKDASNLLVGSSKFLLRRFLNIRPLIKDPIALFSAEWLATKFNLDVVVLIRHPAAFAGSLKRLNWKFPFSHFLEQPLLMRDVLQPFAGEIKHYTQRDYDIIDQAILLWKIFYHVIFSYKNNHDNWIFVRHEDISINPLKYYQTLCNQLQLEFTPKMIQSIKEHSYSEDISQVIDQEIHRLKRDSQQNILRWKTILNTSEIDRIRLKLSDISCSFYSNEDW